MTSSPRMFRRATTPSPTSSPRGSSTPTVLRAAFQESPTVPGGRAFSHRVFHQFERKREGSLRHAPRSDAQLFAQSRRFDHRFCHGTASFPRGHASKLFGGDRAILGTRGSWPANHGRPGCQQYVRPHTRSRLRHARRKQRKRAALQPPFLNLQGSLRRLRVLWELCVNSCS